MTLSNSGGQQLNVTGDSTLTGNINWSQYDTFNIGGSNGAHTLNLNTAGTTALSTVTGGASPFVIGAGGVLNNQSSIATMGGGGTVQLNGGSITGASSGLFTIGDPISGHGTVSGNVDLNAGNETVSGGTLTLNGVTIGSSGSGPGFAVGAGNILDLQGNISAFSFNVNPGTGGLVQFDGTTISKAGTGTTNINNSGLVTTGTFDVVGPNPSTLNNVNFSTGNGANLNVDAPLTVTGGGTLNATNVTVNSTGALNLTNTTGTTTLTTHNLTLAKGSTLDVGAGNNAISLTGNFSYLQTDTINGWTNGGTKGLGPNLIMTGGTAGNPTTLEAGSVNKGGYNPAAWNQNFALSSLTLGSGAYDKLVDAYQNATPSGWTSGTEVLYLDGLFGVTPGSGHVIPTLNLMGIEAFLLTQSHSGGFLYNGLYTDPNGGEVNIIGASPAPEPAALLLFGSGLAGLALVRRRR